MWMRLATLNIQGMPVAMKREEVEVWMASSGVHILAIQEAHILSTSREQRRYTWYFSGKAGKAYGRAIFEVWL